ncbi:MAG: phospholipase D-like domain-containing protein [Polyangiaceae bacterium]
MRKVRFGLVACLAIAACSSAEDHSGTQAAADDENAAIAGPGKADSPFSACQVSAALLRASDPSLDKDALRAAGVHSRAATQIAKAKAGADGTLGTEDDVAFHTLEELDAVPWVGPAALRQLAAPSAAHCALVPVPEAAPIFSPRATRDESHLARAEQLIDSATSNVDIAMYSFSDSGIQAAIGRAVQRGVRVRFIYDPAGAEAKSPAGTRSAALEALGADVRFVNKIMHHKFMIVDGPHDDVDSALSATLLTGSGNWSGSAGTRYDENTVELRGEVRLTLRFQKEFNHLWENSRDFDAGAGFQPAASLPIGDWMLLSDPEASVAFTSANFDVFSNNLGPGFSVVAGRNEVADRLVELIQNAETSIWIASGHLRSRPVSEALIAKVAQSPGLDVRVYLDGQEYVSAYTSQSEADDQAACVSAAGSSESKLQACYDKAFHWSYPVATTDGIQLRFKHYSYRWHYSYAPQMHHKYMLVDGTVLASGSYNLSDNAEHQTMENMVVYRGDRHAGLTQAFADNFEGMWSTGEAAGSFQTLLNEVKNGSGTVPIVYDAMALTHAQVTELKAAIRDACPEVDSQEFRVHPQKHMTCKRSP